ncbi:MAG: HAD family hydrolase [Prolixibacteraceae bacterium]|nr:HAD family hydrolase [Prolixibacteraceae bacterium]
MNDITTILWDWNGTLLNDTAICVKTINELLTERNLPGLSCERYLDVFDFPVKDYYRRIGFDFEKEPFEIPAHRYIELYHSKLHESKLHDGTVEVLEHFRELKYTQLLLSASEIKNLETAIDQFGLREYFDGIAGLDNIYAHSKSDIGIALLEKMGIDPSTACLIGDTLHDREVAEKMGCHCLLVGNGHQSYNRLKNNGAALLKKLEDVPGYFR